MGNEQVAPETKGVAVKLLATVDLGPEIEGQRSRSFAALNSHGQRTMAGLPLIAKVIP